VRQMPVLGQLLTIPHNVAWSAFIPMPDIPSNAFLLHLDSRSLALNRWGCLRLD
jgi:hypothetical protein